MTAPRRHRASPGNDARQRGFVLIAVLWILSALAGLLAIFNAYTLTTLSGGDVYVRQARTDALMTGVVEMTAFALQRRQGGATPKSGVFDFRIGDAFAHVVYEDESLRIDLNTAPPDVLSRLFVGFGEKAAVAEIYANRIAGWRTRTDVDGLNDEDRAYKAAGLGYLPRKAPFESVEELWNVMGLPPALVAATVPLVTIFNQRGEPDRGNAATGVLDADSAQPLADPAQGAASGLPGARATGARRNRERQLKPTRLDIRLTDRDGRLSHSEVVVMTLRDGDEPYYVLSWRDGDRSSPR